MKPIPHPWEIYSRLPIGIRCGRWAQTHRDLETLLRATAGMCGGNLQLRKLGASELILICLRSALAEGVPDKVLQREHLLVLEDILRLSTWRGVCNRIHQHADDLLRQLKSTQKSQMERVVPQIRKALYSNPAAACSLAAHAKTFGMSKGHLSRSFAAIMGKTFRHELKRARLMLARHLLVTTRLKMGEVGRKVGLRTAAEFIAMFRRETGMTPGKYRGKRAGRRPASP